MNRVLPAWVLVTAGAVAWGCGGDGGAVGETQPIVGGQGGAGGGEGGAGGLDFAGTGSGPVAICDGEDREGCECGSDGAERACYHGAAALAGVGACARGTQTCALREDDELGRRVWGPCVGSGLPAVEACDDGVDDDCDGEVDDGCEVTCKDDDCPATCEDGDVRACPCGTETCADGVWSGCEACPPCAAGETQSCTTAGGAAGVQACGDDGTWDPCTCTGDACNCVDGQAVPCTTTDGQEGLRTCVGGVLDDMCGTILVGTPCQVDDVEAVIGSGKYGCAYYGDGYESVLYCDDSGSWQCFLSDCRLDGCGVDIGPTCGHLLGSSTDPACNEAIQWIYDWRAECGPDRNQYFQDHVAVCSEAQQMWFCSWNAGCNTY